MTVTAALRGGAPIDTVVGPLRFDAKDDAAGITYEIDEWAIWADGVSYSPPPHARISADRSA